MPLQKKTETHIHTNFGHQVELNSEGKIQLEETINESIINGDANTTADVSDSTLDDSKDLTQNLDRTNDEIDKSTEPTAAVLSIDDLENGEIFKNHLISNNINNNHIPNKPENETASKADATNSIDTTNDKQKDANGDVVNNDSDTKRLFNNSNTDAPNAVGFHHQVVFFLFFLFCFCYLIHMKQYVIEINSFRFLFIFHRLR